MSFRRSREAGDSVSVATELFAFALLLPNSYFLIIRFIRCVPSSRDSRLAVSYPRRFAFYVADPVSSIPDYSQV